MDFIRVILLASILCTSGAVKVDWQGEADEGMEDFPLDDPGGGDTTDQGGGGNDEADDEEVNDLEDINLAEVEQTESSRQELLRKVMSAAMAKPGARQRLAQVMPILRTMSATQRLALAGLVTSQLMAAPGAPPPQINTTHSNLTDDLMIPISMDIAAMFRGLGRDATVARSTLFRGNVYKRHPFRRRPIQNLNRRNTEVPTGDMKPPPPPRVKLPKLRPGPGKLHVNRFPPPTRPDDEAGKDCEYFTNNICLQVADYPMEDILKSIQSTPNKNAFEALRVDAKQDFGDIYAKGDTSMERRQSDLSMESEDESHMCSSKVEIARPKRARATSGQWKYVVNTGDYTQTLRLEMCLKPKQSCSYLADNFKSECTQVYNYHRLLTWDHKSGLTMDIFKVPTCCSCHIHSLSYSFLSGKTQVASESMRVPSQPIEPIRLATSPPRLNYVEENNFVVADDSPSIHRMPPHKQIVNRRPLHNIPKRESLPPGGGRYVTPRPLLGLTDPEDHVRYSHPQYENLLRRTISRNHSDFNDIRPKYHPVQPTLNQRHPDLPVDSLLSDNRFSFVTSVPDYQPQPPRTYQDIRPPPTTPKRVVIYQTTYPTTPKRVTYLSTTIPSVTTKQTIQKATTPQTPSSKRVNYSYHPIIDFFKTSVTAEEVNETKMSNADWTPITDGPRLMPK